MRSFWNEIDLHIVAMLLLMAPMFSWGKWALIVLLLMPQGRIVTRFWDYRTFGQPPWPYVAANELFVVTWVGVLAVVRLALAG